MIQIETGIMMSPRFSTTFLRHYQLTFQLGMILLSDGMTVLMSILMVC